MISREVKKSILVPLIFFGWFRFPLSLRELRRYLWRRDLTEEELISSLKEIPQIRSESGWLSWRGMTGDRFTSAVLAHQLWSQVKKWRGLFSYIPFIKQVYVSNTLAYDNAHSNSDIDLLIITAAGRTWTARLFLLLILNLLKLRVRSLKRFAKFSPEFFISEKSLSIHNLAIEHDYYLSYWLADLVPIWPDGEHRQFRADNSWFNQDLPLAWRSPKLKVYRYLRPSLWRRIIEKILVYQIGNQLETWAYYKQRRIIEENVKRLGVNPSVVTTRDIIKLHFNDRRSLVRDAVEQTIHDLISKNK
ncbi:MAG: hypothetical protein V1807_01325 [Patescibacteria group bacterium]